MRLGGPIADHLVAAEGMQLSWRWNGVTISMDLGVIWEMSDNDNR